MLTLLSLVFRNFCLQQHKTVVLGEIPGVQEEGEATDISSESCVLCSSSIRYLAFISFTLWQQSPFPAREVQALNELFAICCPALGACWRPNGTDPLKLVFKIQIWCPGEVSYKFSLVKANHHISSSWHSIRSHIISSQSPLLFSWRLCAPSVSITNRGAQRGSKSPLGSVLWLT